MITNIDKLKSSILSRGIAKEKDLIGCEDRELESIEQQYGTLPLAYKQIMKLIGGRDRKWLYLGEYEDFDLARARYLTQWMQEDNFLMSGEINGTVGELENVFFISGYHAEFGGAIQFIKTGNNLLDSFLYSIDMACSGDVNWLDTIEACNESVWEWIQCYLNIAEKQMLKANLQSTVGVNKSFWRQLFGKQT